MGCNLSRDEQQYRDRQRYCQCALKLIESFYGLSSPLASVDSTIDRNNNNNNPNQIVTSSSSLILSEFHKPEDSDPFLDSLCGALRALCNISTSEAKALLVTFAHTQNDPGLRVCLLEYAAPHDRDRSAGNKLTDIVRLWMKFDKDCSGTMSKKELRHLVMAMNFHDVGKKAILKGMKNTLGQRKIKELGFSEFSEIFSTLYDFPELLPYWREAYFGNQNNTTITPSFINLRQLKSFFEKVQLQTLSDTNLESLIWRITGARPYTFAQAVKIHHELYSDKLDYAPPQKPTFDQFAVEAGTPLLGVADESMATFTASFSSKSLSLGSFGANASLSHLDASAMIKIKDESLFVSREQFCHLLTNEEFNSAIDPRMKDIRVEEMDEPLCNYYMNSSHNTYLVGDQLTSESKVEMYIKALNDGCRSVELDCWEGGKENGVPQIVICHGFTATTKIKFEDVIDAIATHAFANGNEYPVTLSFELHVGKVYQKRMVEIMKDKFRKLLAFPKNGPDDETIGAIDLEKDWTPLRLQRKILVKAKRVQVKMNPALAAGAHAIQQMAPTEGADNEGDDDAEFEEYSEPDSDVSIAIDEDEPISPQIAMFEAMEGAEKTAGASNRVSTAKKKKMASPKVKTAKAKQSEAAAIKKSADMKKVKIAKIAPELSAIVMMEAVHHNAKLLNERKPYQSSSFNEARATQLSKKADDYLVELNRRMISRVYPHARRIDSGNFNPMPFWAKGCQLCAMNWQSTTSRELRLNKFKFMDNGGCGFIRKPAALRMPVVSNSSTTTSGRFNESSPGTNSNSISNNTSAEFASSQGSPTTTVDPLTGERHAPYDRIRVTIISAFQLPKPDRSEYGEVVDPYVLAFLEGPDLEINNRGEKLQTPTVEDNGMHPVWSPPDDDEQSRSSSIFRLGGNLERHYEGSMLVLKVFDTDLDVDDFLGEVMIPLPMLRAGVRVYPLYDQRTVRIPGSFVLCKTEFIAKGAVVRGSHHHHHKDKNPRVMVALGALSGGIKEVYSNLRGKH